MGKRRERMALRQRARGVSRGSLSGSYCLGSMGWDWRDGPPAVAMAAMRTRKAPARAR